MKTFGKFVKWFLYIATGILVVCGINFKIAGVKMVSVDVFGDILFSAFVTTLVTVLLIPRECDRKIKTCVKLALHYISLCVIMFFLGAWFGWISLNRAGIAAMAVNVALVYLFASAVYCLIDIKQAGEINRMLQAKYGDEEK